MTEISIQDPNKQTSALWVLARASPLDPIRGPTEGTWTPLDIGFAPRYSCTPSYLNFYKLCQIRQVITKGICMRVLFILLDIWKLIGQGSRIGGGSYRLLVSVSLTGGVQPYIHLSILFRGHMDPSFTMGCPGLKSGSHLGSSCKVCPSDQGSS